MTEMQHALTVFAAFFAIMNPIANSAAFAGLTADYSSERRRKTAFRALCLAFGIVLVFAVLGKALFHFFGITLPALRVAGGVLVFLVGYHMLHGRESSMHSAENQNDESDIAISPLAVPLLAGPGTIATAMNFSASGHWMEIVITVIAFLALCLITYFFFIFSSQVVARIGNDGLAIITRLMGLILAVIGVQMLITGLTDAIRIGGMSLSG